MNAIIAAAALAITAWSMFAWKRVAGWFIALIPFWYAPFLLIPDAHGEQWAALRGGKDWLAAGLLGSWALLAARRGSVLRVKDPVAMLTAIFVLIGLARLPVVNASQAVTVVRIFVLSPLWFYAARELFADKASTSRHLSRWVVASVVVSVIAMLEYALGGTGNVYSRAAGQVRTISTVFNPNALGWYLVWANGLLLGWAMRTHPSQGKLLPPLVAMSAWALNLIAIGLSGSRSAFAVAVLSLACWFLLTNRKVVALAAFATFAIAGIASWLLLESRIEDLRLFSGSDTLRWAIYAEVVGRFARTDPLQLLLGMDSSMLQALEDAGIFDDSFWIALTGYGGLLAIAVLAAIVLLASYPGASSSDRVARAPFVFAIVTLAVLGVVGNVLTIFPHGVLFWTTLAVASRSVPNGSPPAPPVPDTDSRATS